MIGQKELLQQIDALIEKDIFPRFSIICGSKGSGKKMIAKYIANKLSARAVVYTQPKVAEIREIISQAQKLGKKTFYILADADAISINAKNALLKIAEEPPRDCYIIMLVENIDNTLDTIKSRGQVFNIQPYTPKEIESFCGDVSEEEKELLVELCETPEDVQLLKSQGVKDFYAYVEKVVTNIAKVSGANSFKIASKIALKSDEGYDLKLFWKAFMYECMQKGYYNEVDITSKALQDLNISGINKEGLFDIWVLDIRKEWL